MNNPEDYSKENELTEPIEDFLENFDFQPFEINNVKETEKIDNSTKISLIVNDMIPDKVYNIINKLDTISLSLGEIELFSKNEIDDAQKGFRFNPIANEVIKEWIGNNYIIIGYDCTAGYGPNPIIIKIDDNKYPIYWLMSDGGNWKNPIKAANSLLLFETAYKVLLNNKEALENNSLNDEEKIALISEIEKIVSHANIYWWKMIITGNC